MNSQLTLSFSDHKVMTIFRDLAKNMQGVTIVSTSKRGKTGLEKALEDVDNGNIITINSNEELNEFFKSI